MVNEKVNNEVPIWQKVLLSVEEASKYSGIGLHKIRDLISEYDCDFVIAKGRHKMIKREKFEEFLNSTEII